MNNLKQSRPRGLLKVTQEEMRVRHFSRFTEKSYLGWIRRYIRFHSKQHPREVGLEGLKTYLTYLTTHRNVAPATQNQALNALVFLYREVLQFEIGDLNGVSWAKQERNIPVVLTQGEAAAILTYLKLHPTKWLIASLLYGTGMRLIECLRLRTKDLDFHRAVILVHDAKGEKNRVVPFPPSLKKPIASQFEKSRRIWEQDLKEGFGKVSLPYALQRKYPKAELEWRWQ